MEELRDLLFKLCTLHITAQNKLSDLQFTRLLNSTTNPTESTQLTKDYIAANVDFEDMDDNIVPKCTLHHFRGYFKVLRQLNTKRVR